MLTYSQQTGLLKYDGFVIALGFAGCGRGRNNPDCQNLRDRGPLPRGKYRITEILADSIVGKIAFPLEPLPETKMDGRKGPFWIHGGEWSRGCPILELSDREKLAKLITQVDQWEIEVVRI